MANEKVVKETIYADAPALIVPALSDLIYCHAKHALKDEKDRVLVHRITQTHHGENYTVDYISTKILDVLHEYTVVYKEGSLSPFPHTVDLRFGPVEIPPIPPSSSSGFLSSARAHMANMNMRF